MKTLPFCNDANSARFFFAADFSCPQFFWLAKPPVFFHLACKLGGPSFVVCSGCQGTLLGHWKTLTVCLSSDCSTAAATCKDGIGVVAKVANRLLSVHYVALDGDSPSRCPFTPQVKQKGFGEMIQNILMGHGLGGMQAAMKLFIFCYSYLSGQKDEILWNHVTFNDAQPN